MNKLIKTVIIIICLAIFIFSSYKIYQYIVEVNDNKNLNNQLIEEAIIQIPQNSQNAGENIVKEENGNINLPLKVDFNILKQKNKDIVAWIYSENTSISYPVVQSKNNEYYLRRLINGQYNTAGSIFMDFRNKSDFTDTCTILYGHNMKNDTMFGTLPKYKKQEYYEKHKNMYLFTPEEDYVIQLIAGTTTLAKSEIYNINNIKQEEIKEIISKSDFKSEVEIQENDKFIILSTCSYDYENARYIVVGILHNK